MALVTIDDIQPWLEITKLRISADDELVEEPIQSEIVKSRLATRLDVSTWIDPTTTPKLVRYIIGMRIAAMRYNVAYSETSEDEGNPYALKLEMLSETLITGILDGTIDLTDVSDSPLSTGAGSILFYPTDEVGIENPEEAARFTMGKIF